MLCHHNEINVNETAIRNSIFEFDVHVFVNVSVIALRKQKSWLDLFHRKIQTLDETRCCCCCYGLKSIFADHFHFYLFLFRLFRWNQRPRIGNNHFCCRFLQASVRCVCARMHALLAFDRIFVTYLRFACISNVIAAQRIYKKRKRKLRTAMVNKCVMWSTRSA